MQELFDKIECEEPELVRSDINEDIVNMDNAIFMEEKDTNSEIKTLFDNMDESNETYATYYVYIVRESDTIETILQKYNINKEEIELYNDLKELKVGDKIIIPSFNA